MAISATDLMESVYLFMGGTFDPVHNGHLRMATEVREALGASRIHLMPTPQPVHKELKGAEALHRLAMLEVVAESDENISVDKREIDSQEAAYTIRSLELMREELGKEASICMLIGMDSLLTIDTWRRYDELLSFCNIIAVGRPGSNFLPNPNVQVLLDNHQVDDINNIVSHSAGCIKVIETSLLDISSTDIRYRIARGKSVRYLLPDPVQAYIDQKKLYIN